MFNSLISKGALFLVFAFALSAAQSANYTRYGEYYGNPQGPTDEFVYWPDNDGNYVKVLRWGYDIWNQGTEPVPDPGWIVSQDLCGTPYNIPSEATAVRLHIKAKVAGLTYADEDQHSAVQIKFRKNGSGLNPNEMIHATTAKHDGVTDLTPYDLNHVEVDIPIGTDCKVEMYRHPTITGSMLIEVATYLAGYWAPYEQAE